MREVAAGARIALDAVYRDASYNLADPTTPLVDIIDPSNTVVANDTVPVHSSLGLYDYPAGGYLVPVDADLGVWTARWTGTVDGDSVVIIDEFEVVETLSPAAGDTDVITLAEAKRALNIPDATTTHDTELASYITTVSQRLDALVGPIVQRTVTAEASGGHRATVRLKLYPVASVTTVIERQGAVAVTLTAENFAAVTTNDYDVDLANGLLHRRSGGYYARWYPGQRNIIVTYVAGRFDSTATVDERYKQAAAIFLTHLWRKEQGASGQTFGDAPPDTGIRVPSYGVPNAVRDLLSDQLLEPAVA